MSYPFHLLLSIDIGPGDDLGEETIENVQAALESLVKQGDVLEPLVAALSSVCDAEITTIKLVSHIETICQIPITPDAIREHFAGSVAFVPRSGRTYQEVANNSDDVDIAHHALLLARGEAFYHSIGELYAAILRDVDRANG